MSPPPHAQAVPSCLEELHATRTAAFFFLFDSESLVHRQADLFVTGKLVVAVSVAVERFGQCTLFEVWRGAASAPHCCDRFRRFDCRGKVSCFAAHLRLRCGQIKGEFWRLFGRPTLNAFSECPGFTLPGALFVISKFKVAIGKTANEGDAKTNVKIFPRSPAGQRCPLHNL